MLGDFNGDGLPDAIQLRASDGRLMTWIITDWGFADKPIETLATCVNVVSLRKNGAVPTASTGSCSQFTPSCQLRS